MLSNEQARQFAYDSFVKAFEPGNEKLVDQYFDPELELANHSVAKSYNLQQIKASALKVHQKYRDIKSEVKEVIVEGDGIAFRVEQYAFFVPDKSFVNMDVMNIYKLVKGKVREWRLWFSQRQA